MLPSWGGGDYTDILIWGKFYTSIFFPPCCNPGGNFNPGRFLRGGGGILYGGIVYATTPVQEIQLPAEPSNSRVIIFRIKGNTTVATLVSKLYIFLERILMDYIYGMKKVKQNNDNRQFKNMLLLKMRHWLKDHGIFTPTFYSLRCIVHFASVTSTLIVVIALEICRFI